MVALVIIMVADILLTLSFAQIIGPVTLRFSHYGLPGTLFRAPFYLLRLYIGIAVLLFQRQRKWYLWGPVLGLALTLPMAFWATLPICPTSEPWVNLATGVAQGAVLAWLTVRLTRAPLGFRAVP